MFHDLLRVEMAAEVHRRQITFKEFPDLVTVLDHAFLHIDTAQALEIVVSNRDHGDSFGIRLFQAFFHPFQRSLFNLTVHLIFRLADRRIKHHEPGGIIQFHQITQGIRCFALCPIVSEISVNLPEFFRRHAFHIRSLIPEVFSGIRLVDIVISGDHIDRDPCVFDLPEFFRKFQVVCLFSV